jgi:hypothetical protein
MRKLKLLKTAQELQILGGEEIVENIKEGRQLKLKLLLLVRDRMEREIVKTYPGCRIYGYLGLVSVWHLIQMVHTIPKPIDNLLIRRYSYP